MSSTDENLSRIFGTTTDQIVEGEVINSPATIPEEPNASVTIITSSQNEESIIDSDAEFARSKMINIIGRGDDAIDLIGKIAQDSQHPRALEVMSQLLKTQSDNVDRLMKIHRDKREIKNIGKAIEKEKPQVGVSVNNAVFIGSTSELLKRIKNVGGVE